MNELITTHPGDIEIRQNNYCRGCGSPIDSTDNFCGQCGAACRERSGAETTGLVVVDKPLARSQSSVTTETSGAFDGLLGNRWAVIGMVALIGPLGLPALWFSPRFSRTTKTITTIFYVLLTTIVPLVLAWYWLDTSVRPLLQSLEKLGEI